MGSRNNSEKKVDMRQLRASAILQRKWFADTMTIVPCTQVYSSTLLLFYRVRQCDTSSPQYLLPNNHITAPPSGNTPNAMHPRTHARTPQPFQELPAPSVPKPAHMPSSWQCHAWPTITHFISSAWSLVQSPWSLQHTQEENHANQVKGSACTHLNAIDTI